MPVFSKKIAPGLRCFYLTKSFGRAAVKDKATVLARGWPYVDNPARMAYDIEIMLYDEQ